ncbi:cysteine proteinase [Violaceomyces palustris]|uniref:Cysteine proteinase n=1 Tax=Violaceomyces palustris TaxID=1673888 RepID=A0ACD0NMK8_9BASI|nr:cysteine proteinase [Violaceomyces palustris]
MAALSVTPIPLASTSSLAGPSQQTTSSSSSPTPQASSPPPSSSLNHSAWSSSTRSSFSLHPSSNSNENPGLFFSPTSLPQQSLASHPDSDPSASTALQQHPKAHSPAFVSKSHQALSSYSPSTLPASEDSITPPLSSPRQGRRRKQTRPARYALLDPQLQKTLEFNGVVNEEMGAALHAPSPHDAPGLTLSYRSLPNPKIFPTFASLVESLPRSAPRRRRKAPGTQLTPKPPSTTTGPPSVTNSTISSSPATGEPPDLDTSLASLDSKTSTITADTHLSSFSPAAGDIKTSPASLSESTQVVSSPTPTKKAWGVPKSWAELAARGGGASATGPVGISVSADSDLHEVRGHDSGLSSAGRSPDIGLARRKGSSDERSGRKSSPARPRAFSLEKLLADSHNKFNAPLTHPRGLVNNGNFCFVNAILQVLVYCAPFYNLFTLIGKEVPHDFANSTPLMEAVIHFLREFHLVERERQASGKATLQNGTSDELSFVVPPPPSASEPFVPEFVYDAMRLNKRFDTMRRGHQEDAEEFLGFFLDTLHEELLLAIRKSAAKLAASQGAHGALSRLTDEEKRLNGITGEDLIRIGLQLEKRGDAADPVSLNGILAAADESEVVEREVTRPVSPTEEGWMEVGQKGRTSFTRTTSTSDSPITRIFGGKLRSVLRCPGAKDSVTLEPYQPLQLDIQPPHVQSIEDALLNLTVPETIPGVYSPAKGTEVDATKQVFIETLPPILVLHLKRFVYDEVGGVQKSQKPLAYNTLLEISNEVLSPAMRGPKKEKYRLFGVVYHHGRYATGGHYTVDVLRQDSSSWVHIDDTTFQTIPTEQVIRQAGTSVPSGGGTGAWASSGHDGLAYLLFYRKEVAGEADLARMQPRAGVVPDRGFSPRREEVKAAGMSSPKGQSQGKRFESPKPLQNRQLQQHKVNGAATGGGKVSAGSGKGISNQKGQSQQQAEAEAAPQPRKIPGWIK